VKLVHRAPWHPGLFAAAYIVSAWSGAELPVATLIRPLLVAVALAAILLTIISAITRSTTYGGLLTTTLLLAAITWPPVHVGGIVVGYAQWWQIALLATLVAAAIALAVRIVGRAMRRDPGLQQLNYAVNVLAGALFAVAIASAAGQTILKPVGVSARALPATRLAANEPPNFFLVLLDSYPRADALERDFGFQNDDFTRGLESRGFTVSDASRSNYAYTLPSLASLFNMTYLSPGLAADDSFRMVDSINHGAALETLRAHGYQIATVPSPFTETDIESADVVEESGGMTEFEYHLLASTFLIDVLNGVSRDILVNWQKEDVVGTFAAAHRLAGEAADGPRFIFVHIPAPHVPVVLRGDQRPLVPKFSRFAYEQTAATFGISEAEFQAAYVAQVQDVNALTLQLVDDVIAHEGTTPTVVIVMSDHGFRDWRISGDALPRSDLRSRFSTLFAARTPGHPNVFPNDISTVDVLRGLLNAYAGTSSEPIPFRAWLGSGPPFTEVKPFGPAS
jgi:hypothetical protein